MTAGSGKWVAVTVHASADAAEAVRVRLLEFADGRGTSEEACEDRVWLTAYIPATDDWAREVAELADQLAAIRPLFPEGSIGAPAPKMLEEEEWAEAWKRHYRPVVVGRVVIKPSWLGPPKGVPESAVIVELDPKMAFGTGTHATTRLVLRALQDRVRDGDRLADVGTGSGILAIAAALLGALHVWATDNDPVAVTAAVENALANGVGERVTVLRGTYLEDVPSGLDGIVANITPADDAALAPIAAERIKPGGWLAVSGFTSASETEVAEALASAGFEILRRDAEDEWVCLVAVRPA
jgi:ribosomal protein L11 methyltransferase